MGDPQTILIVDDNPTNLYVLENTLSEVDAKVVKAQNGNDALAATLNHDFALCILDVQMPGMNGYELAELLRHDPKTRYVPIIFLSAALSDERHVAKGYKAGGVDYIVKPYDPTLLLAKVRVFLELSQQRTELNHHRSQLETLTSQLQERIEEGKAREETIRAQAEAIVELSTPVIQVWDGILILPLIGTVDATRQEQLMEQILYAIADKRSEAVIIDITGVPVVDTYVAENLIRTVQAARMLGAECVVTGINSEIAQALIRAGVSLGDVTTRGNLQGGLQFAFQLTGRRVVG